MTAPPVTDNSLVIRRATPADADACGVICYEAFATINKEHNFPPDLPSPEAGQHLLAMMFSHPGFFCVVAEQNGVLVGSNCLDERTSIAGVGPITVSPSAQNAGAGRQLMMAVMNRAAERNFAGVRLVQAAFHRRSMSLYAKLGFDIREPLLVMQGPALNDVPSGLTVRAANSADLDVCNALCRRVHGHHRSGELLDAIHQSIALVVENHGRITGYSSLVGFFGHTVGESNLDMQALIGASPAFPGPGFLLPSRNNELFRWCLQRGLRVVQPMTLMSLGLYNTPAGAFLPSILY
jgi:GNAT superfamily N-acetyltransferase